jgi:hypothetical protein
MAKKIVLFSEYADLDAEIKALEAKKVALKIKIMYEMENDGETKTTTPFGTFTRASRKSYEYSEAVDKIAEKLKVAKTKEEQKGIAKVKETEYLVFTTAKDE